MSSTKLAGAQHQISDTEVRCRAIAG